MFPPLNPLFIFFCWWLLWEITPSPSFCVVASSCRKHLMSGPSFGEGPRSRSAEGCLAAWCSSDVDLRSWNVTCQCDRVGLCIGEWAWLPYSGGALQHLCLCPWDLLLSWSQLWEWWQMFGLILVVDQLSLSICSSNMEVAVSACQWASLASASSHSSKVSCLSFWEALSQWRDGWAPVGSGSLLPSDCSPLLCHRWSFKEDKMSPGYLLCSFGPTWRGPGNLFSMCTWWKRSPISSLEVQYPTSWMVGTSTLRSILGRPCWWPQQINLPSSFHPDSVACTNILWRMNGQCGPLTSHQGYSSRNSSMSSQCSTSCMDSPSFFACSLEARDLCHLSSYYNSSRTW